MTRENAQSVFKMHFTSPLVLGDACKQVGAMGAANTGHRVSGHVSVWRGQIDGQPAVSNKGRTEEIGSLPPLCNLTECWYLRGFDGSRAVSVAPHYRVGVSSRNVQHVSWLWSTRCLHTSQG